MDLENKIENYKTQIKKETRKLELLYEDRLAEIITVENYIENAKKLRMILKTIKKELKNLKKSLMEKISK